MTDSYEILLALGLGAVWAIIIVTGIIRYAEGDDEPPPAGGAA